MANIQSLVLDLVTQEGVAMLRETLLKIFADRTTCTEARILLACSSFCSSPWRLIVTQLVNWFCGKSFSIDFTTTSPFQKFLIFGSSKALGAALAKAKVQKLSAH